MDKVNQQAQTVTSAWPNGYRAAVSFSFDDARESQIDTGIQILDKHGVVATFYVSPTPFLSRSDDWKAAAESGHEIGNHTMHHPCCRNFGFSPTYNLESYSLEMIRRDCDKANNLVEDRIGVRPKTFAYPCGQMYVGEGMDTKSYVPVVAERFIAARCFAEGAVNNPLACNMHQLAAYDGDCGTVEYFLDIIEAARAGGGWAIFAGHEIGDSRRRQTTGADVLETVLTHIQKQMPDVLIGTISDIADHLIR